MKQLSKVRKMHIALLFLKYIPVVSFVYCLWYVFCLVRGVYVISGNTSNCFFGFSILGTIELLIASKAFGMCWMHRAMISYCELVSVCIYLQQKEFWGCCLTTARMCVFITGLLLFCYFIVNIKSYVHSENTCQGTKAHC